MPEPRIPTPDEVIDDFKDRVLKHIEGGKGSLAEAVRLATRDAGDVLTTEEPPIKDADSFIAWMRALLQWVPQETTDSTEVLRKLCVFYFVFDHWPLMQSQTEVDPNSVGNGLTILSEWIRTYASVMGAWLNEGPSLTAASFQTFKDSKYYRVFECESPDGTAFHSFNQFFGRKLAKDRPIDGPGDNHVPVYPADSAYDNCFDIDMGSTTWIPAGSLADRKLIKAKGWTWSIGALLEGSDYGSLFAGGIWVHSFLSAYNYHHFRAPVSGKVVDFNVIQNATYLDVIASGDSIVPRRRMRKAIGDGGVDASVKPLDQSGYQFLQTRGYVVIDTSGDPDGDIGLVAVLPIGMAQVSSVILTVTKDARVVKGDDIGYFQFGGSDIVTVFQAKTKLKAKNEPFNRENSKNEQGEELPYTFYGSWLAKISI